MSNPKRLYAELAGTILIWVEKELAAGPPLTWKVHLIRRPRSAGEQVIVFDPDGFVDKSLESALENAKLTVRQGPQFSEYGHRVNELCWRESDASGADWQKQIARFVAEGRI